MRVLAAFTLVLTASWTVAGAADGQPPPGQRVVKMPRDTNRSPLPADLYRPRVSIEDDPDAFYAVAHYGERGLTKTAGGFDADARGWVRSFDQYVANKPLQPTHARHTIYICPLGQMDFTMQQRMRTLRTFLEIYLTLPIKTMPAAPIAGRRSRMTKAHGREVRQYDTEDLKEHLLKPRLPDDALAIMGLTARDLYSERLDWDSVTNTTYTGRGFGVCSLARLFPEPWGYKATPQSKKSGLAVSFRMVADVACGMLGPTPCRKYYCVMNQSRYTSMEEPLHLCPDCLRKLRWTLGFDIIERYEALRQFYARVGMQEEARWVGKRLEECRRALRPSRKPEPSKQSETGAKQPASVSD